MNDKELKILQHNLTRSAKKAKKYWVRGMIGFTESDQGFFPIGDVPIMNPFSNKETTLDQLNTDKHLHLEALVQENKVLNEKLLKSNNQITGLINSIEALKEENTKINMTIDKIVEVL